MNEVKILLVEDNPDDAELTIRALYDARIKNQVNVIKDGAAAIQFLSDASNDLLPDLVLLDINLPKVDGKEVLHFIKTHKELKKIPVVILTTSSSESDILDSYNGHANCYITKPVNLNKFFDMVKLIEDFWITIVKLPRKE